MSWKLWKFSLFSLLCTYFMIHVALPPSLSLSSQLYLDPETNQPTFFIYSSYYINRSI